MRDPNRIKPFMEDITTIWLNCCPDWRFSQVIENVFGEMDFIPWMLEENRMLEEFEKYFKLDKHPEIKEKLNKYKKDGDNNGNSSKR